MVTFGLVILLYILSLKINLTGMVSFRMLPSCLISFYAGMLFVEHRKSAEKYWWIAGILLVILKCIESGNMNIKGHIAGFLMAYMLYGIGTYLMKINIINKVMKFIGGISYEAFLTHHVTICLFIKFVPAEGAGVTGILMDRECVDIYNPKTIRSTMGSVYRMPFVYVEDLGKGIQDLKDKGITTYAAHLEGKHSYDEEDLTNPCAFLIGNEGNGLRREIADMADCYIKIPMLGQVESLNAAIASSVLMFEAARQRRKAD